MTLRNPIVLRAEMSVDDWSQPKGVGCGPSNMARRARHEGQNTIVRRLGKFASSEAFNEK